MCPLEEYKYHNLQEGWVRIIKKTKPIVFLIFALYLLTVLQFTVLNRSIGLHTAQFELFWSYRAAFAGDFDLGREIIANIAMFLPFGFLSSCLLQTYGRLNRRTVIIIAAAGPCRLPYHRDPSARLHARPL